MKYITVFNQCDIRKALRFSSPVTKKVIVAQASLAHIALKFLVKSFVWWARAVRLAILHARRVLLENFIALGIRYQEHHL